VSGGCTQSLPQGKEARLGLPFHKGEKGAYRVIKRVIWYLNVGKVSVHKGLDMFKQFKPIFNRETGIALLICLLILALIVFGSQSGTTFIYAGF
jgi:hypothetical protein